MKALLGFAPRAGETVLEIGCQSGGFLQLAADAGADLFNRACFNYPTLGDLYKYATYDALLQRAKLGRIPA